MTRNVNLLYIAFLTLPVPILLHLKRKGWCKQQKSAIPPEAAQTSRGVPDSGSLRYSPQEPPPYDSALSADCRHPRPFEPARGVVKPKTFLIL